VLIALLRRYDLRPYRRRRRRHTTVMVKVPKPLVDDTPWLEYQQIAAAMRGYIDRVTDRIVADVIDRDGSEPHERAEPPQLAAGPANVND
jgi:hypothetical protein